MKEIVIRYKTFEERQHDYKENHDDSYLQVLIDGNPIEKLTSFSLTVNLNESLEPELTIKRLMDYPSDKKEYCAR